MNNFLLSAALVAANTLTLSAAVDPSPLPSSVMAVNPSQGVVDTSPNANPLGLGEISITFNTDPVVNPSATGVAYCYKEGELDPVATATVDNAYIDLMGLPVGAVSFKQKILSPGEYTVSIPEGFWLLDGDLSPAIELRYEILDLYHISPRAGVVSGLEEIRITCPEADEVVRNTSITPEFYANNYDADYQLVYGYAPGEKQNELIISFSQNGIAIPEILTPGTYLLFAPEGAFTVRTYGPNYAEDPTDVTEITTPEIRMQYQVPSFPAPAIVPEEGLVKEFDSFTLTVTDEMELWMVDDMAGNYIYELLPDGNLADNPVCRLKATRVPDTNQFTLTMVGESPVIPADGEYILRLANGLFSGLLNNEFTSSVAYEYWYEVKNTVGVETIDNTVSESNTVYTFSGIRVLEGASANKVKSLPAGFYIVNGKEVVIR
ncbi:MAG: hypothetical protein HDR88_01335 [Bacteroides sp.]|nr:hypothetical protein [Bacteroides sp.]